MWVAKKYYFSASGLFVTVTRLALLSPLVHFYLRVVSWYTRGSYSKLNSVEICSMKKKRNIFGKFLLCKFIELHAGWKFQI